MARKLRTQLAATVGVLTVDKLALLEQVGSECAGAVQFLPVGRTPSPGQVRSQDEVDRLVTDLPTYHLPEDTALQASLAGIEDKVLLTHLSDGRWGWPEDGAPSTHLIKPEPTGGQALDHLIQVEDWAMRVAAHAGLEAAETRLATFDDRAAIVVTRYDRGPDGTRVHQEDFCQALALDPQAKYETLRETEARGSRLRRLADIAAPRSADPDAFRRQLLSLVTFNVVIGNGDAHSKNYSACAASQVRSRTSWTVRRARRRAMPQSAASSTRSSMVTRSMLVRPLRTCPVLLYRDDRNITGAASYSGASATSPRGPIRMEYRQAAASPAGQREFLLSEHRLDSEALGGSGDEG